MLDKNVEAFVIHMILFTSQIIIYPAWKAQIALLLAEKVTVPAKYSDFVNVFLKNSAKVLPKRTVMIKRIINLEEGKQPSYGSIYSLKPVELKTLKTYIKNNLANHFIWALKSLADAPILFFHKPNGSLCLFIDYCELNNLTIKNQYPLPLIGESLNRLGWVKCFIQLDLTSAYHLMRIKEGDK